MAIRTCMLCDTCDAVFAPDERVRGGIARAAQADGWDSTFTNGTWTNACPDCRGDAG